MPDSALKSEYIDSSKLFERIRKPQKKDCFIDVRTPEEYEAEHIPHFKNYPLDQLPKHFEDFKGKNIIISCKTGARGMDAGKIFKKAALEGTAIIEHSESLQGWKEAGLQTVVPHEREKDSNPILQVKKPFENFNMPSSDEILHNPAVEKVTQQAQKIEKNFIALAPQRQLYVILGIILLISLLFSALGKILILIVAIAMIFSGVSGKMILNDWIGQSPWNKKTKKQS